MDSSQKLTNTDVKKLNKNRIFRLIYNSDKISRQEVDMRGGASLYGWHQPNDFRFQG